MNVGQRLASGLLFCVGLMACAEAPRDSAADESKAMTAEPLPAPRAAHELAAAIDAGEMTAVEAVEMALARIAAHDEEVRAVIALHTSAMDEARALDEDLADGRRRGPLHGVPVLVKDNIETRDGPTTAGSLALAANDTGRDAPIIANLRASGAIILGKTNLSEWANFRSTSSISGWSGVGGQTRNPWSLDRSPCGSSSGSGAAVAAGYVPLGIGTETNGSIMCPSAMNGIVGLKPTVGLLSRTHVVPISPTQDTAGPMTRSVRDAALMLSAMAGSDPADPATAAADANIVDYAAGLGTDLSDVRIGVLRFAAPDHEDVGAPFAKALAILEGAGATLVDIEEAPELPEDFWGDSFFLLQAEFKTALEEYLAEAAPGVTVRTLPDLIAFNDDNAGREMALFDQDIVELSEATGGISNDRYDGVRAMLREVTRTNGIERLLSENDVDVLVAPSRPPAFLIDAVYGDSYPGGVGADYLAAIAGTPNLTVPMGLAHGLPVGLSIMGPAWGEAAILKVGYAFEQARGPFPRPGFHASAFDHPATRQAFEPVDAKALSGPE